MKEKIPRFCNGSINTRDSTTTSCCSSQNKCQIGMGDCNIDNDCEKGLMCGINNCMSEFSNQNNSWNWYDDCCTGRKVIRIIF